LDVPEKRSLIKPPEIETIPSGATAVSPATAFAAAPTRAQQATSEIGENQIIAQVNIRQNRRAVYDTLLLSERSARLLLALRSSKRKPVNGAESYLAIAKKSCAPDRQRLKTELREN
jgi:hypothetical protein